MNAPRRSPGRFAPAAVVSVALAASLGGCVRAHLTPTYGRAYREIFAAQDANPDHKNPKSVHGLDSQEAAIIAGSYRHALAPTSAPAPQTQQLLQTNTTAGGAPGVPPTSMGGP